MQPNDNRQQAPLAVPPRQSVGLERDDRASHQAAANIARHQIDAIYQDKSQTPATSNPYQQTHDESSHQTTQSSWQKYHSAWQNYYQQYYERYYVSQVYQAKKDLEASAAAAPTRALTKT